MIYSKISIIIPCYNQAQFLPETLQSVLDQTYTNWECIIVNDGSPDHTEEVALEWCEKDQRFIYLKKENGGLSSARNAGLEIAKGDYIQFLDSDDLLNEFKFEYQLNCFSDEIDAVISDYFPFDQATKSFNRSRYVTPFANEEHFMNNLIYHWETGFSIPCHCVLFKKELLEKNAIKFNEDLPNHEDWCFWIEFFYFSRKIHNLKIALVSYRIHNESMCADDEKMKQGFIAACENNIKFFERQNNKSFQLLSEQKLNRIKGVDNSTFFNFKSYVKLFIPPIFFVLKNKFLKK